MCLVPFYYLFCHYVWRFSLFPSSLCHFWFLHSTQKVFFHISCRAGSVFTNSFISCLSGKLCLSLIWMKALLGRTFLAADFFHSISTISCHWLLVCQVSVDISANPIVIPLSVREFFCLIAFRTFSLSLYFVNIITIALVLVCFCWFWLESSVPPGSGCVFPCPH